MLALFLALAGVFGGGVGYLLRRVLERRRERDALEIEQSKVKLLTDVAGLLNKFDPTVQERTGTLLAEMLEGSVKNLAKAPKLTPKQLEQKALDDERKARDAAEQQRQAQRELDAKSHEERMAKLHADAARSRDENTKFWVDLYRKPLRTVCDRLMVYAFDSAKRRVEQRDLAGFNRDRAVFDFAKLHWWQSMDEGERVENKTDGIEKRFAEAFGKLESKLDAMLKATSPAAPTVELPSKETKELPSASEGDAGTSDGAQGPPHTSRESGERNTNQGD